VARFCRAISPIQQHSRLVALSPSPDVAQNYHISCWGRSFAGGALASRVVRVTFQAGLMRLFFDRQRVSHSTGMTPTGTPQNPMQNSYLGSLAAFETSIGIQPR
jgi:hypothetical protein